VVVLNIGAITPYDVQRTTWLATPIRTSVGCRVFSVPSYVANGTSYIL